MHGRTSLVAAPARPRTCTISRWLVLRRQICRVAALARSRQVLSDAHHDAPAVGRHSVTRHSGSGRWVAVQVVSQRQVRLLVPTPRLQIGRLQVTLLTCQGQAGSRVLRMPESRRATIGRSIMHRPRRTLCNWRTGHGCAHGPRWASSHRMGCSSDCWPATVSHIAPITRFDI